MLSRLENPARFLDEYHIGWTKGASYCFDATAKARIRALLQAQGIAPETPPDAWDGLTRAESLALGRNEKWADGPARRDRVAVKTLPGRPLLIGHKSILLPPLCHVEADVEEIAGGVQHDTILLVENSGMFRPHPCGSTEFLRRRSEPFGDLARRQRRSARRRLAEFPENPEPAGVGLCRFRPTGLVIAATLHSLQGIISPEASVLAELLDKHSLKIVTARNCPPPRPAWIAPDIRQSPICGRCSDKQEGRYRRRYSSVWANWHGGSLQMWKMPRVQKMLWRGG